MRSAWQVGLFVVVFVALVVGGLAVLQKGFLAEKTDTYYAKFADAGGLASGAPVLLSGVQIGKVESVKLDIDNAAVVRLAVRRGQAIPKSIVATLPTSFVSIGDKQVLLKRELPTEGFYAPGNEGDPIPGKLLGPLEGVVPDSKETVAELNKTLVAFQNLLNDQKLKGSLTGLMDQSKETAAKFGALASRIDGLVAQNQGSIGKMLGSMTASMENLQAVSVKIKQIATDGALEGKMNDLLASLNEAAVSGKKMVADLQSYTSDPEIKENLKATMANFKQMSESGTRIAADAEIMAKNGAKVSGSGVEIGEKASALLDKANKLATDIDGLVQKFKETVDKVKIPGLGEGLPKIGLEAGVTRETDPNRNRTDITAIVPIGKDYLHLGLYDAFESNKVNLQYQKTFNPRLGLRYGVHASKPGIGVDYAFAPNAWLQSDVFGLNDTQFDLRLKYGFGSGILGWIGVDRIFERNAPTIGIGIKK
ncbi:MAG: MCE family protein [Fimbriimonadaceae bacterium]|nr:MCE family protein [Fimbriimonadaceae bacterium]